jgi:hypothetical protein
LLFNAALAGRRGGLYCKSGEFCFRLTVRLCIGLSCLLVGEFLFFTEVRKVTSEEKKLWAQVLLQQKAKELGRIPKKDDFDEPTRSRIKAFLGPWPRALESAGLKQAKPVMPKVRKSKKRNKKQY